MRTGSRVADAQRLSASASGGRSSTSGATASSGPNVSTLAYTPPAGGRPAGDRRRRPNRPTVTAWTAYAGEAPVAPGLSPIDPLHESRRYSMTNLAIHDALNAIDRRSTPYALELRGRVFAVVWLVRLRDGSPGPHDDRLPLKRVLRPRGGRGP